MSWGSGPARSGRAVHLESALPTEGGGCADRCLRGGTRNIDQQPLKFSSDHAPARIVIPTIAKIAALAEIAIGRRGYSSAAIAHSAPPMRRIGGQG